MPALPPDARPCTVDTCRHPAVRAGLCESHRKQRRRLGSTRELRPYRQGPRRAFINAVVDLLEVDAWDGEEWQRAWNRVRMAARRYVLAPKPSNRYAPLNNVPTRPHGGGNLNSGG